MSVKLCKEHEEQAKAYSIRECPFCRIAALEPALKLLEMCDLSNEEDPTRKVRQIAERALRKEK